MKGGRHTYERAAGYDKLAINDHAYLGEADKTVNGGQKAHQAHVMFSTRYQSQRDPDAVMLIGDAHKSMLLL